MTGNIPLNIPPNHRMASNARKAKLTEALNRVNLQIRPDSKLCRSYVAGELPHEWSLQRVVDESALMHWLYNCTRYPVFLADARAHWKLCFACGADFDLFFRFEIIPSVKSHTVRLHGGVPAVWPWLTANEVTSKT